MKQAKQINLGQVSFEFEDYWKRTGRKVHGGVYSKGKRKTERPYDSKKPVHLVLRSSKARGPMSMLNLRVQTNIKSIVDKCARKWHVKIYEFSNNGNHLHILLRARRKDFQNFLRVAAGLIARFMLSAKKGKKAGKFWDALAFTRVADWGKAYDNLKNYVIQNILEAAGVIPYKPRTHPRGPPR